MKYNLLYTEDKTYGWRSGRPKTFLRGNDVIHQSIKSAIKESVTLLDIGCGRGFWVDFFRREYPWLQITCVDIAAKTIRKYRPDLNIVEASADNLNMFKDNQFDLITHLDGMEHIPVEIEEKTFAEECRVAKRFVYHQIATHAVARDKNWEERGLGAVHINLKTASEWKQFFDTNCLKYNMTINFFVDYRQWVHVLLEKSHVRTACNND
jgi:ubiquinone/menaquinone biosynthesis C-methylase UbiE